MPHSYDHTITGQVIRRLRLERGMSQEVLSGLAAISRTHLSEIESGKDNANVETLWHIASGLDIRLSDLSLWHIASGLDIRLSDLFRRVEDEIERRA